MYKVKNLTLERKYKFEEKDNFPATLHKFERKY